MPSRRMSVYPSLATDRLFDAVPGCTISGRISQAADAYMQIMNAEIAAIKWTKSQWNAVLEALRPENDTNTTWNMAWAGVASLAPELNAKWQVDAEALAQEIRGMSIARKLAVYEAAERFWAREDLPVEDRFVMAVISPIAAPHPVLESEGNEKP